MKGVNPTVPLANVTNIRITPASDKNETLIFVSHDSGIQSFNMNAEWSKIKQVPIQPVPQDNTNLWETETVVDVNSENTYIVFMLTKNRENINQTTAASTFYRKRLGDDTAAQPTLTSNISPLINGNLCFASPYLFLFGSNGLVQFSNQNDPFTFSKANSFNVGTDKIIYGRSIRGGPTVPSLLIWTLSTVVRVTNTGPGPDSDATTIFKPETISNDSSILSSRSVVEYNGFFFWPGTDRFFVYNGIVDELPNRLNLNYFYDNLDLSRRQQVFGVKNVKYGEIWWFYPDKNIPGPNSRAIVWNKRENFWYDVKDISREAGAFSNDFGFMATYGLPFVNPANGGYLWRHEESDVNQLRVINGTAQAPEPITSYFISPIFSWVAFPPKMSKTSQPSQLVNRWIDLQRIEPDFVDTNGVSNFTVEVLAQEYAQSKLEPITTPIAFNSSNTTPKIDLRAQGRNLALKFSSSDKFEVGQIMLLVGLGDAR